MRNGIYTDGFRPEFDTPSQINAWLWVGSGISCDTWDGPSVCVAPEVFCRNPKCVFFDIYASEADPAYISRAALDALAEYVASKRKEGGVLIHCAMGMERSPLAAAWCIKVLENRSWHKAWHRVKSHRTVAQNRRVWLERKPRPVLIGADESDLQPHDPSWMEGW